MGKGVSGFRSPQQADHYFALYDRTVNDEWPVPHAERDLPCRFGTTHVRLSGDGEGIPLVMIHPTTGSSAGWYPLIRTLAADRRVVTPDTIGGAGRSVQTQPITTGADLVAWLDDVLDGLGLERVHLLGYSEGGWIAAMHAAGTGRSERLASLTLIEPAGAILRVPGRFLAGMIFRGMRVMTAKDKSSAVRRFNRWMNGDVELTEAQIELIQTAMGSFQQRLPKPAKLSDDELRSIAFPTLLLLGADSKLQDASGVRERAESLLPNVVVDVIDDAGHGVGFQYPDLIAGKVVDHINGVEHA